MDGERERGLCSKHMSQQRVQHRYTHKRVVVVVVEREKGVRCYGPAA